MDVKLIWITPEAEKVIAYNARVSNPNRQFDGDNQKLLNYCKIKQHWSIFEQASACFEIVTTRAISAQMIRHRSFSFQEYSQRYALAQEFEVIQTRLQDHKNRQNSLVCNNQELIDWWHNEQLALFTLIESSYNEAIQRGIAKEVARNILPLGTKTKLAMTGTIRSWIHYLDVRTQNDTQLEHRQIAIKIKEILKQELPLIF